MQEKRAYLDKDCISHFVSGRKSITLRFSKYTYAKKRIIDSFVEEILALTDNKDWSRQIEYCMDELVSNAVKANLKRLVFKEKGWDIEDPEQYTAGMAHFRSLIQTGGLNGLMESCDPSYFVRITFAIRGRSLVLSVLNNSRLNYYEELRMFEKRSIAKESGSLSDLLLATHDGEEGSGLGLIVMLFMLKKIGLQDAFVFSNTEEGALTSITLPLAFTSQQS